MLDHVSIGVRDLGRARRFYDAVLAPLGYTCLSQSETSLGYGSQQVALWIGPTEHPVPAHEASNLHFCFAAPNAKSIDQFHAAALRQGGKDNGKPGVRTDYAPDYYAAFVIDPDGYRLEAYCAHGAAR